jgi:hypothetical protein
MIKTFTIMKITPPKKFLYLLVALIKSDVVKFHPNDNMS